MSHRFIAFVLTRDIAPVAGAAIVEMLAARFSAEARLRSGETGAGKANPIVIDIGSIPIAVIRLDSPMPDDVLREPLAKNRFWPEAPEAVRSHRAHYVVSSVQPAETHQARRRATECVTLVCAALCELTPAVALLWSSSRALASPQTTVESAQRIGQGEPALALWLNPLLFGKPPASDGTRRIGVLTMGLSDFVGRDIEFTPSLLPLPVVLDRVLGMASYLIANGPVLADGDTVGTSQSERIRVQHDVLAGTDRSIYRLSVELAQDS